MNMKTHNGHKVSHNAEYSRDLILDKRFEIGSQNFVFLIKEAEFSFKEECKKFADLCDPFVLSTASGVVLSSDKSSIFVLTAAHFCVQQEDQKGMFSERILGFAGDVKRDLFILKTDIPNDICLLMGVKKRNDNFNNIKIAENFTIGEDVYTVASPLGMGAPGLRLIFTGQLSGCAQAGCMTTIPATFGSSGAGIFNKDHELISIVMAVPEEFGHIVLSPSNQALIKFISDIDAEVDIYPY